MVELGVVVVVLLVAVEFEINTDEVKVEASSESAVLAVGDELGAAVDVLAGLVVEPVLGSIDVVDCCAAPSWTDVGLDVTGLSVSVGNEEVAVASANATVSALELFKPTISVDSEASTGGSAVELANASLGDLSEPTLLIGLEVTLVEFESLVCCRSMVELTVGVEVVVLVCSPIEEPDGALVVRYWIDWLELASSTSATLLNEDPNCVMLMISGVVGLSVLIGRAVVEVLLLIVVVSSLVSTELNWWASLDMFSLLFPSSLVEATRFAVLGLPVEASGVTLVEGVAVLVGLVWATVVGDCVELERGLLVVITNLSAKGVVMAEEIS